jgi:hypothetical protein
MVSTWVIGRDTLAEDLLNKLPDAPWDIIVVVMGTAVADDENPPAWLLLKQLSTMDMFPEDDPVVERIEDQLDDLDGSLKVLKNKAIYFLGNTHGKHGKPSRVCVILHKAKVSAAYYDEKYIPAPQSRSGQSRSTTQMPGVRFGTLHLLLDKTRQKMSHVAVGIIYVEKGGECEKGKVAFKNHLSLNMDSLVAWIIMDKIDLLTGYFGDCSSGTTAAVADLARQSHAISRMPMWQGLQFGMSRESPNGVWTHPTYWLIYGFYKKITTPMDTPAPEHWFGNDIIDDMVPSAEVPVWLNNDHGSASVGNVGHIKMKPADMERWFDNCIQTCLWLGCSTPSYSVQNKAEQARNKKKKGSGNSHRKWQGKDDWKGQRQAQWQ